MRYPRTVAHHNYSENISSLPFPLQIKTKGYQCLGQVPQVKRLHTKKTDEEKKSHCVVSHNTPMTSEKSIYHFH